MNITCPSCQVELRLSDSAAGRRVKCPHCTETFDVEAEEPPEELLEFEDEVDVSDEARKAELSNRVTCPMCGAQNGLPLTNAMPAENRSPRGRPCRIGCGAMASNW
jgi:predicted Zn finger-like uncharacterized protein